MKLIYNKIMKKGLIVSSINYDSDLDILELYTSQLPHNKIMGHVSGDLHRKS